MTQNLTFILGKVEKIVGKEENAGYQHFLLFSQIFQKISYTGSLKVGIVSLNPLPLNDKFLNLSKLKASADDKMNEAQMMISVHNRVENIVANQHFLVYPQCF